MTFTTPFLRRFRDSLKLVEPARVLALIAILVLVLVGPQVHAHEGEGSVVVIPIHGTIEPGTGEFLDRAITEAEEADTATIIIDLNTPGGRLDTVLEMRTRILETEIPIVAYVNREAFSAGALITIASDQIWMAPGAVFGAATPVDGATGETASAKTVSAVRSVFRATAETQGRDPQVAEAMVDPAVVVEGLDDASSLLTLSANQARDYGYANGVAADRYVLLDELGFGHATVTDAQMSFWERMVSWVTDPLVGSVLVLVGMGLIVADGLIGGFGIAAVAGLIALGLFFWGYLLTGLAGWEDLLLIGIGVLLIALEVFVIPGFGIAGIAGTVSLVAGLVLTMTMRDIGEEGFAREAGDVLGIVVATLIGLIVVLAGFLYLFPRLVPTPAAVPRGLQRLSLSATVEQGGHNPARPGWLARMTGGGEAVERDDQGHTAMEDDRGRKYTFREPKPNHDGNGG
jgi:membrane-bound serine protease (ClpP class)